MKKLYEKESKRSAKSNMLLSMICGVVSGTVSVLTCSPLDLIKTRMQIQRKVLINGKLISPSHYEHVQNGLYRSFKNIIRNEGFFSIFKGIQPTVLAIIPNWILFFTIYNYSKQNLKKNEFFDRNKTLKHIVSSVIAGGSCNLILQPLWTIKIQTQSSLQNVSMRNIAKEIFKHDGFHGFYMGTIASLFGLIHVGIQFPLYEYIKKHFRERSGRLRIRDILVASSVSKVIASSVAYPHEVVRCRLQDACPSRSMYHNVIKESGEVDINQFIRYKNTRDAVYKIYKMEGVMGFYGGIRTNIVKTVPNAVICLLTYELCRKFLKKYYFKKETKETRS